MSWAKRMLDAKQGRRVIRQRMKEFAKQAPLDVLNQMVASAEDVTGMMKRMTSDDKELSESIGFGPDKPTGPSTMLGGKGRGMAKRSRFGHDIIYIWAGSWKVFWAKWREFGTRAHSLAKGASAARDKKQDKGPHHPGEKAAPFFWPSWRAYKKQIKKDMAAAYKKSAEKAMGKR